MKRRYAAGQAVAVTHVAAHELGAAAYAIKAVRAAAPEGEGSRAGEITGVVCGVRVEEVEDPLMQQIRYLDKLVDELAKGKAMEKILRKPAETR